MKDKILKLLNSTNIDDVKVAIELAVSYESLDWFDSLFREWSERYKKFSLRGRFWKEEEQFQFKWGNHYYCVFDTCIWRTTLERGIPFSNIKIIVFGQDYLE